MYVFSALAMFEVGDFDVGDGYADDLSSLATHHLAMSDVFAQIVPDLATDNVFESSEIAVDAASHRQPLPLGFLPGCPGGLCVLAKASMLVHGR